MWSYIACGLKIKVTLAKVPEVAHILPFQARGGGGSEIELIFALQATVKEIKQFFTLITLIAIITKTNKLLILMGLCHPGKLRICMHT